MFTRCVCACACLCVSLFVYEFTLRKCISRRACQRSACPGGGEAGMTPIQKDHPFCAPWGSPREGGDFVLSLVCCLDAFKRSQLEDTGGGESSEPPTSGIGPKGAVAALNLEEMNNQKGRTDRWASPAPSWVPSSLGAMAKGSWWFPGDAPPRAPSICVLGSGATGRGAEGTPTTWWPICGYRQPPLLLLPGSGGWRGSHLVGAVTLSEAWSVFSTF